MVISGMVLLLFLLEVTFEAFEKFELWARSSGLWESWELDEFIVIFTLLAFAFAVYSWRRWRELKAEMAERQRAQEKIKKEEEFIFSLLKGLKPGLAAVDREGKQLLVNDELCRMTGFSEEELLGQNPPFKYWAEESIKKINESFEQSLKGIEGERELVFKKKNGERFIVQLNPKKIINADGHPIFYTTVRDITAEKKAQEALWDSEARYRYLFENNPLPMWIHDMDTLAFLDVNDAAVQHYGYSREEFLSMTIIDIRPAEDIPPLVEAISRVRGVTTKQGIWRHKKKDGTIIAVDITNHRLLWGERWAILTLAQDVTERQRTEEVLKRHQLLFNQARDIILFIRPGDGRILEANQVAVKTYGYTCDELLALRIYDLRTPETRDSIASQLKQALDTEGALFETRHQRKDGSNFPVEISSRGALFKGERVLLSVIRDITGRKQAEEALQAAYQTLEALIQASPLAIMAIDLEGKVKAWNPAAEKVFGWTQSEVLGRPLPTVPDNKQEEFRGTIEYLLSGKEHRGLKLQRQRKDGSLIDVSLWTAPLRDAQGNIYSIMGIIENISERQEMEAALKESEERYRTLVETSPDAVIVTDLEARVSMCNQRTAEMLGYDQVQEIVGKYIFSLLLPRDQKRAKADFKKYAKLPTAMNLEYTALRKNGSSFPVEVNATDILDKDGKPRDILFVVRDITRRQQVERGLREQRDLAQKYLDVAKVIFVVLAAEQTVVLINDKGCEILGYEEREIFGKNWFDNFIPPGIREELRANFKRIIAGEIGLFEYHENPVLRKGGEERIIAWHNTVLENEKGKIIGTLSSGEDITEKKQLEAQLLQSQKIEAVGTLAGGVAHDFNNLLAAMMVNLELAKLKMGKGELIEPYLEEIEKVAQRAALLTHQLLAFSRRQLIQPQPLNLNDTITHMSKMLSRLLGEHIQLALNLQSDLGLVKVDPGQLEQVIMNLCVNARDAMPAGGKLIVETRNITLGGKDHPWVKAGHYVLLEVNDNGQGMDELIRGRIFEPFFTTKEVGKGTGLGLSMVYGMVKQHQGYIDVYSERGHGTTFKIFLPRLEGEAVLEQVLVEEAPEAVGGKETILLAEDEDALRGAIQQVLELLGYTVLPAKDGQEAVDIYGRAKKPLDLVILDAVMPRMGGVEVAHWIYKQNPAQKILFSSGYSAEGLHESFVIPADMHFIKKPYTAKALAQKVREVLET